jgi:hypothetical protein
MSNARYSSGQKTDGGDDYMCLEEEPCACSVSVAEGLPVRRLNKDFNPLDFLIVSLLPLLVLTLALALVAPTVPQVPR